MRQLIRKLSSGLGLSKTISDSAEDVRQTVVETQDDDRPRFARATKESVVPSFFDAVAAIGGDGNVGALLVKMSENDVIAVFLVENDDKDKDEIPYNPLILGDDEFSYVPFFDSYEAYEAWLTSKSQEVQSVSAPVVIDGGFLFSVLSHEKGLHTVLNVHLDTREVIYDENLKWIRNYVVNKKTMFDANVMMNIGVTLPDHCDQEAFKVDLSSYFKQTPVNQAYYFVVEAFDKVKNVGVRDIFVYYNVINPLIQSQIYKIENGFSFDHSKYNFPPDIKIEFMEIPNNQFGKTIAEESTPFYFKEN